MYNLSRTLIALVMILVFLLIGCAPANLPESTLIPTEVLTSESSNTPTGSSATASPASTLQPTDQPLGRENLNDYPLLEPGNLDQIVFLEARNLDPKNEELNFRAFDWSKNGDQIVICIFTENSSSYQVFDLIENMKLADIQIQSDMCRYSTSDAPWLQFSRDGSLFLGLIEPGDNDTGDQAYVPAVFDIKKGDWLSILSELSVGLRFPPSASFSSQGTRLALSETILSPPAPAQDPHVQGGLWTSDAVVIELYDVQTGNYWGSFLELSGRYIRDLEYSTEGEFLVAGVDEYTQAWHVAEDITHRVECPWAEIAFSPAVEIAALSCLPIEGDPYQLLWDLESGNVYPIADAPGNYFHELKFSPNGQLLTGLSKEGVISFWDGESGELYYTYPDTFPTAVDVHFIGDGKLVAVLLEDGRLQLYGVK